jgi:hypothetical protein
VAKKNTGPVEDDNTLYGWYEERQRRSQARNPTRSVGDDRADKGDKKREQR